MVGRTPVHSTCQMTVVPTVTAGQSSPRRRRFRDDLGDAVRNGTDRKAGCEAVSSTTPAGFAGNAASARAPPDATRGR